MNKKSNQPKRVGGKATPAKSAASPKTRAAISARTSKRASISRPSAVNKQKPSTTKPLSNQTTRPNTGRAKKTADVHSTQRAKPLSKQVSRTRKPSGARPRMQVIDNPALMQAAATALRRRDACIGYVPTMGALHDAHMTLMQEARRRCDVLVTSIFVNPKQFNDAADLRAYPRDLASDREKCAAVGVDILFAPDEAHMYPQGFDTKVSVSTLAQGLCGAHRPGHFDGVCTVVCKLFGIVRPHFAVFGEKDYQQLQIIRRMVRDLSMPIEILGMPVMRELDGLAMSSRNARLKKTQRGQASGLMRAIEAAQKAAESGERNCDKLIKAAQQELNLRPMLKPEYVEIVDPESLIPLKRIATAGRILIAAKLGDVRLIDNGPICP